MKNNDSTVLDHDDVRDICYSCSEFQTMDWYNAPHIDIKAYFCKSGGCKDLAECYNKEKFRNNFQHKIIKKFL